MRNAPEPPVTPNWAYTPSKPDMSAYGSAVVVGHISVDGPSLKLPHYLKPKESRS